VPPPNARRVLSPEALAAVLLWGVSFVATRVALEFFHPVGLIATRLTLGAAVMLGAQLVRRSPLVPEPGDRLRCTLLGTVLGGHLLLQAYGLLHTTAIQTAWIIAFIPVLIALGGHVFLGRRLLPLGWLGVLAGAGGVLIVAAARLPDFENARFGDILQLISCVTWTVYTLAALRPAESSGPLRTTAFAMAIAALMTIAVVPTTGVLIAPPTTAAIVSVAFLGLGCNGLAFWLWTRGLRRDGPAKIGAMLYFEPFVTLGASLVVLHEPLTVNLLVGGPIVLVGVWLVGRGEARN